jgi:hypothetical protein
MSAEGPEKRDSRALEPNLITDPNARAEAEARNGLRQYDAGINAIQPTLVSVRNHFEGGMGIFNRWVTPSLTGRIFKTASGPPQKTNDFNGRFPDRHLVLLCHKLLLAAGASLKGSRECPHQLQAQGRDGIRHVSLGPDWRRRGVCNRRVEQVLGAR